MEKEKVKVAFGDGPFENTKKALSGIDIAFVKGKSVLVKPNVGRLIGPGRGINTHPDAVAAVIEVLLDGGAKKVTIGESPIVGVNTMEAFKLSGIADVAERYGCDLVDMDMGKAVEKEVPDGILLSSTKICSEIFNHDILLSLPVAKCHMHTGVTLGIKNLKGCLYKREKIRYHQLEFPEGIDTGDKTLDTAISDLATILLPDITVIDGYIGMEGLGPSGGEPIMSDFSVASTSPMGADVIGSYMMGKDPEKIPHLRLTAERLGLPINHDDYSVSPDGYDSHRADYSDPPSDISNKYPDVILVDRDSCSACLSTVMLFLKRFKTSMDQYLPEGERLCLAIGKGVKDEELPKGAVLVGNCARLNSGDNIFVKGCPPVATKIYEAITGEEPPDNEPDVK